MKPVQTLIMYLNQLLIHLMLQLLYLHQKVDMGQSLIKVFLMQMEATLKKKINLQQYRNKNRLEHNKWNRNQRQGKRTIPNGVMAFGFRILFIELLHVSILRKSDGRNFFCNSRKCCRWRPGNTVKSKTLQKFQTFGKNKKPSKDNRHAQIKLGKKNSLNPKNDQQYSAERQ